MKTAIGRTATRVLLLMLLFHSPMASADQQLLGHVEQQTSHSENHFFFVSLIAHAKEIGLSADQLANIKALQLDFDLTRITADADIMLTEHELAALFGDDKAELSAVEAKIHQSEAMKAALRVASFKALRKALALLTPEQREKSRRILAAESRRSDSHS